jgi:hypothetical protein
MRLISSLAGLGALVAGIGGMAGRHSGALEARDYAVYDAVLDSLSRQGSGAGGLTRFVVVDSTVPGPEKTFEPNDAFIADRLGSRLVPLFSAARADYEKRGATRLPIDVHAFRVRGQVELVSRSFTAFDSGAHGPAAYWAAFYRRFPGSSGRIELSLPGYDAAGTHALLYYGHGCGGRCGDWGYVLLERRDNKWYVLRRLIDRVS